jgi:hypothetical protein
VGLIDKVRELGLDDDVVKMLEREHDAEVTPLREIARRDSARAKLGDVEKKVENLSNMGFNDAPDALAFYRRVQLSDTQDGNEGPAIVLMSDSDLGLSGDQATGASGRQEMSASEMLDAFIAKFPVSEEGKLKVALSDQALANEDTDRPESGAEKSREEQTEDHRKGLSGAIGRDVKPRNRNRYRRGGLAVGSDA